MEELIDLQVQSVWTMIVAAMVISMQTGFLLLEVGILRKKFTRFTITKSLINQIVVCLSFYAIGYTAETGGFGGVLGTTNLASTPVEDIDYSRWLLGFAYAGTACTIASGSLASRCVLESYGIFTFMFSSVIYPVISCWVWGGGWLQSIGFKDFAGAGVIHLSAGLAGLIGTTILGPRLGFAKTK